MSKAKRKRPFEHPDFMLDKKGVEVRVGDKIRGTFDDGYERPGGNTSEGWVLSLWESNWKPGYNTVMITTRDTPSGYLRQFKIEEVERIPE